MRVYVSTSSKHLWIAKALMFLVRERGHTVTYDWTESFDDESKFTDEQLADKARDDIEGATSADIVLVYMQKCMATGQMIGTAVEIGAALAAGIPVFVVEYEVEFSHFFHHHRLIKRFNGVTEALDEIGEYEKRTLGEFLKDVE